MSIFRSLLLAVLSVMLLGTAANAQTSVALYCWNPTGSQATNNQFVPCQSTNPLASSSNQGTPAAIGNAWPVKITDGTNTATLATGVAAVGNAVPVAVGGTGYPTFSTPITGNATGSTGAVTGTLAGSGGKLTYICGFDVSAIGGTAAIGPITVAGLTGSSMVYQLTSSATGVILQKVFTPCIPGSGANTAITITTTADGTATAVDVNSWGYQQ